MKILFAPINIASMPAITAKSLNGINGVKARYISSYKHKYLSENSFVIKLYFLMVYKAFKDAPLWNITYRICYNLLFRPYQFIVLCRWIMWADVVHWSWDNMYPSNIDLKLIKALGKKRFIEWV